ncbi:Response regulator receiver domain-containing protein [Cohaesibacter sp. ES.047]|uniref:response regulator transcription factor n=1 Tax=Cohaesibacter sp. ES.047 TaxID=1798205 RepID=UPI000BB8F240|nr:response regulator [Cohaesibacter sp. ES.047]SNY91123.1 Response regulator receiver domain-containing protein [Cohaesibacter sp. ES.047]SNY91206.1 Response regulator receiver domain-containing protein [Cohaesibacter sp. ES.047]
MAKSILVVDDEASIAFALEHLMKAEGYDVTVANDGEKALDAAAAHHPDLILLDVCLPGRDGYDVCQTLRSEPKMHDVKIVMMSARSRDIEIEKGLAVGADAYLSKPFSMFSIVQTVETILADNTQHPACA